MANKKVRLLPLKSIGGVGNPGDEVWMSQEDADRYAAEGFVEIVTEGGGAGVAVISEEPAEPVEDHKIMKPQNRRGRKK